MYVLLQIIPDITVVVSTEGVVTGAVDATTIPLLPGDTTDVRVLLGETTTEVVDTVDVAELSDVVTAATNETIAITHI